MRYILLISLVLLAGCNQYGIRQTTHASPAEVYGEICSGYGFKQGSESWSECIMDHHQNDLAWKRSNENKRREAALMYYMNQPSFEMPKATYQPIETRPPRTPTNTTCRMVGNDMSCTTW